MEVVARYKAEKVTLEVVEVMGIKEVLSWSFYSSGRVRQLSGGGSKFTSDVNDCK